MSELPFGIAHLGVTFSQTLSEPPPTHKVTHTVNYSRDKTREREGEKQRDRNREIKERGKKERVREG